MRVDWRGKHDPSWLLLRVTSGPGWQRPFVAGLLYSSSADRVMRAAPILKYLLGADGDTLRAWARANGCTITRPRAHDEASANDGGEDARPSEG